MLYLIGIGLGTAKDITLRGLEAARKCDIIYLESYTSALQCSAKELEKEYDKHVIPVGREFVESEQIVAEAKEKDVALLIIGDVFSATTHAQLALACRRQSVAYEVIHNASVLTAVGDTGLDLYKFGRVVSIPFHRHDITTPITALEENQKLGLHTLFLLDLDPAAKKYLSAAEGAAYLISKGVKKATKAVTCCALGSNRQEIAYDTLEHLEKRKLNKFPQCLIVPGRLHFMEQEMLQWHMR
ncbi:diphthine synthase [Candidatus Woesearchaeota archaeon]|nr:diphthine synthase [Candidatus Woesearchaeota archaeon]